jgi:hypothetical protein
MNRLSEEQVKLMQELLVFQATTVDGAIPGEPQ